MPQTLVVKGSGTTHNQLDKLLLQSNQRLRSWINHDKLGYCIRLGLARGSYLRSSTKLENMGLTSLVIDYDSLAETGPRSYDVYHKTTKESLIAWKELVRLGLLHTIVDHNRQLAV